MSPIDGTQYHAERGWETYEPDEPPPMQNGPVQTRHVLLLTEQYEMGNRVNVAELGAFIKEVNEFVIESLQALPPGPTCELVVQLQHQPGGALGVKLAAKPSLPDEVLRPLRSHLMERRGPVVRGGSISYQLFFALWP